MSDAHGPELGELRYPDPRFEAEEGRLYMETVSTNPPTTGEHPDGQPQVMRLVESNLIVPKVLSGRFMALSEDVLTTHQDMVEIWGKEGAIAIIAAELDFLITEQEAAAKARIAKYN